MRSIALVALGFVAVFGATACAPMLEVLEGRGGGCEGQQGLGPRNEGLDPPGIPLEGIEGLTPAQADAAAAALGHVVVFRLDSSSCVCVPPAGYGPVNAGWWGSNGVLFLDLQDVRPQGNKLLDGTGC